MPQATRYQRSTDFAADESANVGGRSTVRTAQVNAELDTIGGSVNQLIVNQGLNQRDDGEIRDGRVKLFALSSDVLALLAVGNVTSASLRGPWVTLTAYVKLDLVSNSSNTYICAIAHTAGTFATDLAANKWLLFAQGATAAASIGFTPTTTLAATDVQAAIEEADTENRSIAAANDVAIRADLLNNDVAIRADLLNVASLSKGAGQIGFNYALSYVAGTIGKWLKDLATAAGSTLIGYIAAGSGAVLRTVSAKLRDRITVEDFGAIGDGATDDSAAFTLAFATAQTGTKPGYVRTTPGKTYLVGDIAITAAIGINNTRGEYPMVFDYRGSTLKIKASATVGLRIGRVGAATDWCNGIEVYCGTMDMALMSNADTSRGIEVTNSYSGLIHKHTVVGEGSAMWGLYFRDRAYAYDIYKLNCLRVKSLGVNISTDSVTTLMFTQPDVAQINLENTSATTMVAPVIQSAAASKVVLKNTYNTQILCGDIEGTSGAYLDLTGGGNSYVQSIGNNITDGLTYVSGVATASRYDDKKRGTYGVTYGMPAQNISTTGATTIFTFDGDPKSGANPAGIALVLVTGDDGTRGWTDLVIVAYAAVYRAATNATYGVGQPTRTYTLSGINLQLQLNTVAGNNVMVLVTSNPT